MLMHQWMHSKTGSKQILTRGVVSSRKSFRCVFHLFLWVLFCHVMFDFTDVCGLNISFPEVMSGWI